MKTCNENFMSSGLCYYVSINQMHGLMYIYNFFNIGFEVTSYDYNPLYSCLEHLVTDFLVTKDNSF
jgi:hypothetical protein